MGRSKPQSTAAQPQQKETEKAPPRIIVRYKPKPAPVITDYASL